MNDRKIVDLNEYVTERSKRIKDDYLKEFLTLKGLEPNEENIKLAEYDMDFSDELKHKINESNLLSLIKDGNVPVSYRYENRKITLTFSSGETLEILVDVNGNLQTSLNYSL